MKIVILGFFISFNIFICCNGIKCIFSNYAINSLNCDLNLKMVNFQVNAVIHFWRVQVNRTVHVKTICI